MTYWDKVKALAWVLKGDGCTAVPDLTYKRCCDEHDIHYRTGNTVEGNPITRLEADNRLFQCMKETGKTPLLGTHIIPTIYWIGVRLFGGKIWDRNK